MLARYRRGELSLPDELAADLASLVAAPPGQRRPDAAAGLRRWQTYANGDVSPSQNQAARVIVRSYELATHTEVTR